MVPAFPHTAPPSGRGPRRRGHDSGQQGFPGLVHAQPACDQRGPTKARSMGKARLLMIQGFVFTLRAPAPSRPGRSRRPCPCAAAGSP